MTERHFAIKIDGKLYDVREIDPKTVKSVTCVKFSDFVDVAFVPVCVEYKEDDE